MTPPQPAFPLNLVSPVPVPLCKSGKLSIMLHPQHGRVQLKPLKDLDKHAWQRIHAHFRDPEIAYLNGTPPNRMPLWLLRRVLKADSRRADRDTFGVYDEHEDYIGTIELYDIRYDTATLGIIIGEKSHWSKGYGPEAIAALLKYAFYDLNLRYINLNTFADNSRAQAAFKKVGFKELRRVHSGNRGRIDVRMRLSKESWLSHHVPEEVSEMAYGLSSS